MTFSTMVNHPSRYKQRHVNITTNYIVFIYPKGLPEAAGLAADGAVKSYAVRFFSVPNKALTAISVELVGRGGVGAGGGAV